MTKSRAAELLDLGLATMRGLSLLRSTSNHAEVERRWRRARDNLLALYERL
jgi:hypothetical protein